MTTLAEWKVFRAKLVKALDWQKSRNIGGFCFYSACKKYKLPFAKDVHDWYCGRVPVSNEGQALIEACFANSIAHANEQINKLEASNAGCPMAVGDDENGR